MIVKKAVAAAAIAAVGTIAFLSYQLFQYHSLSARKDADYALMNPLLVEVLALDEKRLPACQERVSRRDAISAGTTTALAIVGQAYLVKQEVRFDCMSREQGNRMLRDLSATYQARQGEENKVLSWVGAKDQISNFSGHTFTLGAAVDSQ